MSLTCGDDSCILLGTPTRCSPKELSETLKHATLSGGRARQFLTYGLSVAPRLS